MRCSIGFRESHQLEGAAQLAGRRQVRPAAEVDESALLVDADRLVGGQVADDLRLVQLAKALEIGDRSVAVPDLARDRLVAGDDLGHPRLDLFQILGGKRLGPCEVVIEPVLDRRADRDLGIGIELLDRLGHDMGGVVAQQFQRVVVLGGDDRDLGILRDP
jgi:hypothetical protein